MHGWAQGADIHPTHALLTHLGRLPALTALCLRRTELPEADVLDGLQVGTSYMYRV